MDIQDENGSKRIWIQVKNGSKRIWIQYRMKMDKKQYIYR